MPTGVSGRTALEVAEEAVRVAGRIIMERFMAALGSSPTQAVKVSYKDFDHVVTDVDHAAESAIIGVLETEFPRHRIVAEESGEKPGNSRFTWIIDPLDGTRNFAAGVPHFAVSVALVHGTTVLLGVTFDPSRNELFYAMSGGGAYLNGKRMQVSKVESLRNSIVAFDVGPIDEKAGLLFDVLVGLWRKILAVRISGSATLGYAYAAAGRVEVYSHHHLAPWDIAAGLILVREAGGIVTDLQGGQAHIHSTAAVAGSTITHPQFLEATTGNLWRDIGR